MAKTNCRKRKVKLMMISGRGWLLETVEDGFLLKRAKAITKVDCCAEQREAIRSSELR